MKRIKTWVPFKITISLSNGGFTTPLGDVDSANHNRLQVIQGALSVENYLKDIIIFHFFGAADDKAKEFNSRILDTDWCSYGNKCKLARDIIAEKGLLEKKELDSFEQLLRKVGNWRNAFAHGNFEVDHDKVFLCYYKEKPRRDELSEDLLTEIELLFGDAYSGITKIHSKQKGEDASSETII